MRIVLAQVDSVLGEVDENLERARDIVHAQAADGADLVVFPELFLTGYSIGDVRRDVSIEIDDGRLASLAAEAGDSTAVLIGFVERGLRTERYNSAAYLQGGAVVHTHRKVHLANYDIWEEGKHFTPGSSLGAFDSSVGRMATLICYDLWHPALVFVAVQHGARILLVPSNSVERRFSDEANNQDQWKAMTRFYASVFECYVVFINRVGVEGELTFWGGSHVMDPRGSLVVEGPRHEEALVVADIDPEEVRRRRQETPLVQEAHLGLLIEELNRIVVQGGHL